MRVFQKLSKGWPDETSTYSKKILDILHCILKRLASFGPRGLGLITGHWQLRTEWISSGFGSVLMMSTSESSSNRANIALSLVSNSVLDYGNTIQILSISAPVA
jgi:hypothetical protein